MARSLCASSITITSPTPRTAAAAVDAAAGVRAENTSPDHSTSGSRHKAEMNEAINSLTSEMVRSCHMSSFYSKWRTNLEEDEAMVRALMAGGGGASSSSGVAVAGRSSSGGRAGVPVATRRTASQVAQRVLQSERDSNRQTTTTTTTTTRRTLIMVQNSDSGIVDDVADDPK